MTPQHPSRSITLPQRTLTIRRAEAAELIDLRHRVLRTGLRRQTANFVGDDLPTTHHYGVFDEASALSCATFLQNEYEKEPAWQLRGMATDERFRSQGLGRQLLNYAEEALRADDSIRLLWCNARLVAVKFYQNQGWRIASDLFEIPHFGPHHFMVKRL
jgi:GNAT superfamily N-acetyltransferase